MDVKLTEQIQEWLNKPLNERDFDLGALLLLKLTGNKILYNNIFRNAKAKADIIEYQLSKFLKFRLMATTKEDVAALDDKVSIIIKQRLDKNDSAKGFASGKRADHEDLPDDIKSLFDANFEILQKMRECQTQLRLLSADDMVCKDSERYPFLKELISLDKQLRSNWDTYDHFVVGQGVVKQLSPAEESKAALRLVNLNKGKFKKKPSEELRTKICAWYTKIINPSDELVAELKELNILV